MAPANPISGTNLRASLLAVEDAVAAADVALPLVVVEAAALLVEDAPTPALTVLATRLPQGVAVQMAAPGLAELQLICSCSHS